MISSNSLTWLCFNRRTKTSEIEKGRERKHKNLRGPWQQMRAWHALRKCLLRKMTLTELYLNQKPACEGTELGLTLLLLTRKENSNLFVWTSHWFSLNLSRWTLMGNNKVKQFYSPRVPKSKGRKTATQFVRKMAGS